MFRVSGSLIAKKLLCIDNDCVTEVVRSRFATDRLKMALCGITQMFHVKQSCLDAKSGLRCYSNRLLPIGFTSEGECYGVSEGALDASCSIYS